MKNTLLGALLFLIFTTELPAQKIVKGVIANMPSNLVQVALIDYWSVDHWQQVKAVQLEAGGAFSAPAEIPTQTQGRIRIISQPRIWADFIFPGPNATDTVLTLQLDFRRMNGGPAEIQGSEENERYAGLMSAYQNVQMLRDTSSHTPAEVLNRAEKAFNQLCSEFSKQFKGSFTGDIVTNLLFTPLREGYPGGLPNLSDQAFGAAHALDKIPFGSERVLQHSAFSKAIGRYADYFDLGSPEGAKNYIEGIMSRRNGSEAVDLYLFKYLLEKLLNEKNEAGINHLLTWYLPDCSDDSPLPDYTKSMVLALKNCAPGNTIADLQMTGEDGAPVSLGATCAKNKMTLLFFWKTNCSHCKEFKPVLIELYDKYRAQGLEVYAFSLDKTEAGWKETLQKEPTKWVNVYVPIERRQEINRSFPIPSTPTLIALDKDRKVLSRMVLREHLEAYLKETLSK